MPMSLKKGAKFSLTKAEPRLERVHIGLGWDVRPGGGARTRTRPDTGNDSDEVPPVAAPRQALPSADLWR